MRNLADRAAAEPENGVAAFDYASALDAGSREAEAIPFYQRALSASLDEETTYRAMVQLGSSLRVVGRAAEAVRMHEQVAERWPDRPANRLFLALALHHAGSTTHALTQAIEAALEVGPEQDTDRYRRALRGYAQELTCGR